MESMAILDQNLAILRSFQPLAEEKMAELREHGKQFSDGRYELYKRTLKYDAAVGRNQHRFPTITELPA